MDRKFRPPQHQVFINFRGDELRRNFISHLIEALERNEINLFTDKLEKKGEYISHLFQRIEDSQIALAVFSKRYTESRWCLDELVKIKECVDLGKLKVLPIFYNVSTNEVKGPKGEFSDHLRDRENEFKHDEARIKRWKEALSCISGILGLTFHTNSLSESEFIGDIVSNVLRMLQEVKTDASPVNKLPEREETSTTKKNSKKSNKAQMGNIESSPQAIASGKGSSHITIEITHEASPANPSRHTVPRVQDPHNKVAQRNLGSGYTVRYDNHKSAGKGDSFNSKFMEGVSPAFALRSQLIQDPPNTVAQRNLGSGFPIRYGNHDSAGKGDSSSTTNKSKKPLKPSKKNLEYNGWPS